MLLHTILIIIAAILVILGILRIVRGDIVWGVVLIVVGLLVGQIVSVRGNRVTLLERRAFLSPSSYVPIDGDLAVFARTQAPAEGSAEETALALNAASRSPAGVSTGSGSVGGGSS